MTGRRVRVFRSARGTRKDAERELARLWLEATKGALVDLGRVTVEEWLRSWLDVKRVLHAALEDAVRQQVVGRNVCDAVRPPKTPARELRVLDRDELLRLLREAEGTRMYVPVLLASLCGLRRGEVLALRCGSERPGPTTGWSAPGRTGLPGGPITSSGPSRP
ncbi:MAG: hypothetical protein N0A24_11565 [Armatimonadetes bacterium]|nr:hypothetical protein [Armatimonadota bacterium]MDW8154813.1 hypothetical protein [Armatimonadota bacterium]